MASLGTSHVVSCLAYSIPPDDGVAFLHNNADSVTGIRRTNIGRAKKPMAIENVRGNEDSVGLDSAGFQFYQSPSTHKSFFNDEEIKREYYPESAELIKKLTGATSVLVFGHTIRRRRPGQIDDGPDHRQPALSVHVDQTIRSTIDRVHLHFPSEAPELLKHRFQIINLWRPISHAAYDWPLALCDYRSVDPDKDTFPISLVLPDSQLLPDSEREETLGVIHNERHRWKYLRGMTPDELVLIKCSDSLQDGSVAGFAAHTAFKDPSTPIDAPLRESVELRTLVLYN